MRNNSFLAPVLLAVIAVSAAFAQSESDYKVSLTDDYMGAVITGYTGRTAVVRIPSVIQGMPVREIGSFKNNNVTSVVVPEGVNVIRANAFKSSMENRVSANQRITMITLPNSLRRIEYMAFYNLHSLHTIVIPEGVTEIGDWAFAHCLNLTSVTFPSTIRKIGASAFFGCKSLTNITFNGQAQKIEFGDIDVFNSNLRDVKLLLSGQSLLRLRGYGGRF